MKNKKQIEEPFFRFMIQKSQILDFAIILGCSLLAYFGIKYCYPYPLTYSDSGGYIDAAINNVFYIYRPFGYSYFLRILHAITTNIHSIFIVQLFLLFLATSFLALTVKYFYTPTKKWVWYFSLLFLIFAPTSFTMANWIMSDLLFSVQIYFMVSLFIFIIKRKSWIAAILYILLLYTALHVRYSAVVFPFVMIPFFFMKKGKIRWVIIFLSIVVFSVFYLQIKESMKERVKIEQFSTGFDGWVYANNVLYTLPYIDLKADDFKNAKLKNFHNFMMEDIDIIEDVIKNNPTIGANFMWNRRLPLKQYHAKIMQEQKTLYLPTFVKLGSGIYKDYAIHIITHYPSSYLRHYYLPNFVQTFYPYQGCIREADQHKGEIVYKYYNVDEQNPMQAKHDLLSQSNYHSIIKILHLMMWLAIAGIGIAAFLKRKKIVFSSDDKIVFWGVFSFAVIYYASSIFAAPMEIRYTIGMHSIQFLFCYILLNKLVGIEKGKDETTEKQSQKLALVRKRKFKPIVYLSITLIVVILICGYMIRSNIKMEDNIQEMRKIKINREMNNPKMSAYIEACEFCKNLSDTILVITRKPEIFYEFSDKGNAIGFSWNLSPDSIMSYIKTTKATHLILDDRFRYAYLTLYPAVQKYSEKFKVLKRIGEVDTTRKTNPTYVFEFNDEWGYYGERVDGEKSGEGYEIFQDGRKYVGHFENNSINGEGTIYDQNGNVIYKGFWQDGTPDGYGTLYDTKGNILNKGKWRNGIFAGAN